MNNPGSDKPPRWTLVFFRWFCQREYREDIEGDLLERFHKRLATTNSRKAKWLFIKDVLLLFRPGVIGNVNYWSEHKLNDMKKINWKKLAALNLLVVLMIISPFMPGPSNKVVGVLSFLGQLTGIFGLLLVPVGLLWTIIEIRNSKAAKERTNQVLHYQLAIAATLLIALVFLVAVVLVPNPMPKTSFFIGLLLVLSGFILVLRQIRKWKDNNERITDHGAEAILAAAATSCITFMFLFSTLAVFVLTGIIPGLLALLLLAIGLFWVIGQIKKMKEVKERKFNRLPLYLLTMPLVAFLAFMFLMKPASDFSRSYAIKRGEALIASIEDHKKKTGQFPESIEELYFPSSKKIPTPFIMGTGDFRYNKINDDYSLSFSQWLKLGSLEEIVLYDKNEIIKSRDALPPYNYGLDLHRAKGAFAIYNTRHNNWRYYHVD